MTNIFYNIKSKIIPGLLSLVLITNYSISYNLNEYQAKNHAQNLIDTLFNSDNHSLLYILFNSNHHSDLHATELKDFSDTVTRKILDKIGKYPGFFSFVKIYDTELIYKELINESIDFIVKSSKQYAKDEIYKSHCPDDVNKNNIITKVSKSIKQQVTRLVDESSYLDTGVFANWYGVSDSR